MASSAAAKYQARWRPVGTEQWSRPRDFEPRAEITVDGLDRNTEYEFEVRSVAACGASSVWVPQGYTVPDPPALPPPGVPTTKPGPDGIDLDWGDGEDGVRGDLTYEIQRAKILGAYASAGALVSAHPTGTAGDAYFVGSAVYGWDGSGWVDIDEAENAAWTTVAKTKGTTWTDVVLDTDAYTYRIRSIDFNGNVSGWIVIGQSESATISTIEFADEVNDAIAQEITDRIAGDAANAQAIIDEATERAALGVELAVVRAQVGDILEADEWVLANEYPSGDLVQHDGKLYRALQDVPASTPITNAAYWELLGNYASLGEAVGATAAQVVVNTAAIEQNGDDITAVSQTVAQHAARMPSGTGELATEAEVTSVESASVSRDNALGTRIGAVEVRMPDGTGELATASALSAQSARIDNVEGDLTAVADDLNTVEARMPSGGGVLATAASVTAANQARADGDAANASAILQVKASTEVPAFNLISNPGGENGTTGWTVAGGTLSAHTDSTGESQIRLTRGSGTAHGVYGYAASTVGDYTFSAEVAVAGGSGTVLLFLDFRDAANNILKTSATVSSSSAGWVRLAKTDAAPANTARVSARISTTDVAVVAFRKAKLELGSSATAFTRDASVVQTATATQSLTTNVNALTGKVNAAYTLTLDVNGYISGIRSENTGSSSSFDIVADKFRIVSPGGGARTEFSGGNWRVYDGSGTLRVRMGVW